MSAGRRGGRRRRPGLEEEHEGAHADERWLITYADMITLLMALFIVLYAMSTVDSTKFKALASSLQEAFKPHILPGAKDIRPTASSQQSVPSESPSVPTQPVATEPDDAAKRNEEDERFKRIKEIIDSYAARHGYAEEIKTTISRRGLEITLLADNILFASGQATLSTAAAPLLSAVDSAIKTASSEEQIAVEGHTDTVPIRGIYPTNWELSTARASSVVRYMIGDGMAAWRLSASGYAGMHPAASNATDEGRARNRRVEIVLLRHTNAVTEDLTP